ncbi:MAG: hypothetical protein KDD11_20460, partial [Acidobacteria bacterium]|nr:hypothetical protein [Acidobacteriota bacterium]
DALGRAEALDRLAEVCSETRLAGCPDPAPLAGSLATKDPDRLVRQVAARWAERLGAPAGGRE